MTKKTKTYLLKQYGNYVYSKTTTRNINDGEIKNISFIADSIANKTMASKFVQDELDWMLANCPNITYEEV